MNSLVCGLQPLYPKTDTPWIKQSLPQHRTATHHRYNPLQISCSERPKRLHAGSAKGFGVTVPEKYRRREEEEEACNKNNSGDEKDDDDTIPEAVFYRMLSRIAVTVGTPMATSVGLVYLLGTLKEQHIWDVPTWLPYLTLLVGFGTSPLGIVYGTLSSSWDPDRKGTFLGWEEVQKNWPVLWKEENDRKRL